MADEVIDRGCGKAGRTVTGENCYRTGVILNGKVRLTITIEIPRFDLRKEGEGSHRKTDVTRRSKSASSIAQMDGKVGQALKWIRVERGARCDSQIRYTIVIVIGDCQIDRKWHCLDPDWRRKSSHAVTSQDKQSCGRFICDQRKIVHAITVQIARADCAHPT